jgi:hypothetical protein
MLLVGGDILKKIVFFFLFFFLCASHVIADNEIYYSKYFPSTAWSESEIFESDTKLVETERRHMWYQEENILGDYYIEGANDNEYPLIDYNDYIETDYSDWNLTRPEDKPNRIINDRYFFEYQDMKEIRYIHISDIQGSYGALRISEIEIFAGNNKVNYNFYCQGCNSNFSNYINNGITIENMSNINNGGYLRIDLNNYYPLDSVKIKLYLFDVGTETKKYTIKMTRDMYSSSPVYTSLNISKNFSYNYLNEIVPFTYSAFDMNVISPEWYDKKITFNHVDSNITRFVLEKQEFQYKDFLYRYYKTEKIYCENYYKEQPVECNIKDENQFKDYYRYQQRDKVVIQSDLIIKDKNINLEDFIIDCTTDFEIHSDIDINNNGIYEIKFILPFDTIIKQVTVDIPENNIIDYTKEISSLVEEIKIKDNKIMKLKEENKDLKVIVKELDISKINNNLKKINDLMLMYDNEIKSLYNQLQEQRATIESLNEVSFENDFLPEVNNQKEMSIKKMSTFITDYPFITSLFSILIFVFFGLIKINKKRSN